MRDISITRYFLRFLPGAGLLLLASAGFSLFAPSLYASDCADSQVDVSTFVAKMEASRSQASSYFIDCAIHGPNADKEAAILDSIKAIEADKTTLNLKGKEACFKTEANVMNFLNSTITQMAQINGMAIVACSEKAQEILRNPKYSERKKNKLINKLFPDIVK